MNTIEHIGVTRAADLAAPYSRTEQDLCTPM